MVARMPPDREWRPPAHRADLGYDGAGLASFDNVTGACVYRAGPVAPTHEIDAWGNPPGGQVL